MLEGKMKDNRYESNDHRIELIMNEGNDHFDKNWQDTMRKRERVRMFEMSSFLPDDQRCVSTIVSKVGSILSELFDRNPMQKSVDVHHPIEQISCSVLQANLCQFVPLFVKLT